MSARMSLLMAALIALAPLSGMAEPMAEAASAEQAGRLRDALNLYLSLLKTESPGSDREQELRTRVIALAAKIRPPLSLPKEAQRSLARGEAALERAKSPADFAAAIRDFHEATRLAPWHARAYFKLAVAQEKSGKPREAVQSYKHYLQAAPRAKDAAQVEKRIYAIEHDAEASAAEAARKNAEAKRIEGMAGAWRTLKWYPVREVGASNYDMTRENDKPTLTDPGWSHTRSPMPDETASVSISGTRFEADIVFLNRDLGRFVGEIEGRSLRGKMNYTVRQEHDAACPGFVAEFPFEGAIDPDNVRIMLLTRGNVTAQVGKCAVVVQSWGWNSRLLRR